MSKFLNSVRHWRLIQDNKELEGQDLREENPERRTQFGGIIFSQEISSNLGRGI